MADVYSGSRQKLPAARGLDELDAVPALVVVMAQLLERGLQLLDRRVGFESGQRLEGRGTPLANSAASSSCASGVMRGIKGGGERRCAVAVR